MSTKIICWKYRETWGKTTDRSIYKPISTFQHWFLPKMLMSIPQNKKVLIIHISLLFALSFILTTQPGETLNRWHRTGYHFSPQATPRESETHQCVSFYEFQLCYDSLHHQTIFYLQRRTWLLTLHSFHISALSAQMTQKIFIGLMLSFCYK